MKLVKYHHDGRDGVARLEADHLLPLDFSRGQFTSLSDILEDEEPHEAAEILCQGATPLPLEAIKPTGTRSFLERRELVAVNIGGPGSISVDGERHALGTRDMLYAGMGTAVTFASDARRLASAAGDGTILLWDTRQLRGTR